MNREEVIHAINTAWKDGKYVDLSQKDLSSIDLRYIKFEEADLGWTNLCGANLYGADLRGADLRGTNLCGTNLCGANLCEANLCEADLRGADLRGADLRKANLRGADLRGANLCGADIDFSCWPLWCGSLDVIVDKRIAVQLAYHFCSLICDDSEVIAAQNAILPLANQFHRVGGSVEELYPKTTKLVEGI